MNRLFRILPRTRWLAGCLALFLLVPAASAKIQFDVFAGYGDAGTGHVRTGGWFPIGFEVMNDGPSFEAVIEVTSGQLSGQTLRVPVELPTNTRKRLVIPAFSTASSVMLLDARLLDAGGKVRAESGQLRLNLATWECPCSAPCRQPMPGCRRCRPTASAGATISRSWRACSRSSCRTTRSRWRA